jgi:hypothetical protein
LYRKLGFVSVALALEYRSLAILRMSYALAGAESGLPSRRWHRNLRTGKLLAARGEEVGDVVNRVVGRPGVRRALLLGVYGTLVFVLIGIVG